jgi:hypothetical protein
MESKKRLEEIFARESLSSYLPYQACDPASGIFIVEHGLGMIFECLPKSGVGLETVQVLEALYAATFLPAGATIQVMLYASPSVGSLLSLWREARSSKELFSRMAEARIAMLQGMDGSVSNGLGAAPIRDFRLLVSVGLPHSQTSLDQAMGIAQETFAKVEGLLQSMHLYPQRLSPQGLIGLIFELLNPAHPLDLLCAWDESLPLREQMVFADSPLRIEPERLYLDGRVVKSLSVKQYPPMADLTTINPRWPD